MELKEKIEHYTHFITDQNKNEWKVIETSDLEDIMESYHQDKLKNFDLAVVSNRRELLSFMKDTHRLGITEEGIDELLQDYFFLKTL